MEMEKLPSSSAGTVKVVTMNELELHTSWMNLINKKETKRKQDTQECSQYDSIYIEFMHN